MCAGQTPDAACFPAVCFRCAEGERDGVWVNPAFPATPRLPFLSLIFSIAEARQERRGRRVKGGRLWRVHRSAVQTLDWLPALRTIARGKWGYHFAREEKETAA